MWQGLKTCVNNRDKKTIKAYHFRLALAVPITQSLTCEESKWTCQKRNAIYQITSRVSFENVHRPCWQTSKNSEILQNSLAQGRCSQTSGWEEEDKQQEDLYCEERGFKKEKLLCDGCRSLTFCCFLPNIPAGGTWALSSCKERSSPGTTDGAVSDTDTTQKSSSCSWTYKPCWPAPWWRCPGLTGSRWWPSSP